MKKHHALLVMIFLIIGCTNQVWAPEYKEENITGFYVVKQRHELFVAGKESGYIFPINQDFEEILILSRKINFTTYLTDFVLEKNNIISGKVTLMASEKNISAENVTMLYELGFKKSSIVNGILKYDLLLKGSRYNLDGALPIQKLEKPYPVRVAQPDSRLDVARKIVATPGAIVIDATVMLPSTLLLVLIMSTDSL